MLPVGDAAVDLEMAGHRSRATVAPPAALGGEAQAAQLRFEGVEARQVRIARECASSSGSASASQTSTGFAVFGLALALLAKLRCA